MVVLLITVPSFSGSTENSLVKVSFLKRSFFLKDYKLQFRGYLY
jgi:hypothetical protein